MAENSNHIHSDFSHSDYSVAELINVFQLCNEKIYALHQNSSEDFKTLSIATRHHYKQAFTMQQTVGQIVTAPHQNDALLPRESKDSLTYLSNIITVLQFDDIVRQKLEHIQQTIVEIIEELHSIQQNTGNKSNQPIKYIYILPEITKLHAAQLLQTNRDYQKAITSIRTYLKGVQQSSIAIRKYTNILLSQHGPADLKSKLTYINNLAEQLASQISSSLEENKYCESFAYEVGEINKHMHKISSGRIAGITTETQPEILAQLEEMYTMESERDIHHKVLDIDVHTTKNQIAQQSTDAPDDVELF